MSAGSAAISGGGEMPAPPQPKKSKRVTLLGILFLFVTFSWALVLFAVMTAMYPLVRLLDDKRRRFHDNVAILWAKLSMASVFCVPRVLGRENLPLPDQSAIYVANHQSFTDIYSMAWLDRRMKFVSKIEILRIPIIGWAMSYCKHVALRRGDRRAQVEAYRAMLNSLRDGNSLAIYPEGTRSVTGRMRKFQSGAFKASISTGVPIVPVTIVGTRELMPPEAYLPVRYPPDGITLIVHPMIYPEGKSEQELNTLAFREINSGLPEVLQAGSSSSSSTSSSS
eukprot:CAMPEP_0185853526 /NCGR_PEP_ID=MMETSP1354-20130828/19297_1 /TAXON_ID=708628 /ORGANISM="Erythrolobus madagascarensis, Strain CCMP3276" /LENGTH=280 /DNA_ID=CAMNT_0028555037 /DNA_START=346 /DNA_END=1188 /DNA_ORIENTATION=+